MKRFAKIEITELFLVKADWNRTYMGEITRETQEDGKEFVRGKVIIDEGMAWSTGESQADLASNLDNICTMKLVGGLHANEGPRELVAGASLYLN